jgi:hypothetical protein
MLPEGRPRSAFFNWVGNRWIQADPEAAGDWFVKEINEKGYDAGGSLAKGMLEEWVEITHDQPFEYIERIEDGEARDRAMTLAMMELARENPEMAAERLVAWETVDLEQAEEISDRLMDHWMGRDAKAASEWVNTLVPGIVKDAAISELVETVLRRDKDYEGARAWVNEVESEKVRESLTREIERAEKR